jgi:hypothetical protein
MTVRLVTLPVLAAAFLAASSCSQVDLRQALQVSDVSSGWYDDGVVNAPGQPHHGWNHLVPMVSFRLRNGAEESLSGVQLTVSFWRVGEDGEFDSVLTRGIGDEELSPGGQTEVIEVRGKVGFNLEGARADLFMHSRFQDVIAKLFARRGGTIVPLGEYPIERRIVPQQQAASGLQ